MPSKKELEVLLNAANENAEEWKNTCIMSSEESREIVGELKQTIKNQHDRYFEREDELNEIIAELDLVNDNLRSFIIRCIEEHG